MEDSKLDLREVRLEDVESLNLAQDRKKWRALVNIVTNHEAAYNAREFFSD
jgi:hypothetical protein